MTKAYQQGYKETILALNKKAEQGKVSGGYLVTQRAIAVSCTRTPNIEPESYQYHQGQIAAIDAWEKENGKCAVRSGASLWHAYCINTHDAAFKNL